MTRMTPALALSFALLFAAPAGAQPMQEEPTMQEQAMRFERVEGPDVENVPGGLMVIIAYAVIWLLVAGFVLRLGLLHRGTAQDVARLERSLAAAIAREEKAPAKTRAKELERAKPEKKPAAAESSKSKDPDEKPSESEG